MWLAEQGNWGWLNGETATEKGKVKTLRDSLLSAEAGLNLKHCQALHTDFHFFCTMRG
jgi:hypothetical protein